MHLQCCVSFHPSSFNSSFPCIKTHIQADIKSTADSTGSSMLCSVEGRCKKNGTVYFFLKKVNFDHRPFFVVCCSKGSCFRFCWWLRICPLALSSHFRYNNSNVFARLLDPFASTPCLYFLFTWIGMFRSDAYVAKDQVAADFQPASS
jgi:hypothetical protein